MQDLITEICNCTVCLNVLPFKPNPVFRVNYEAKILIIGQAPGLKVHNSGIPWNDLSGMELRKWLNVSEADFYDTSKFAIIPMGFCYPGKGKNGDLPPRKECAPLWHDKLMRNLPNIELIILIGQYAQNYYLSNPKKNLTETVKSFSEYLPLYFCLPHPSPRNRIWLKKNIWFEESVLPILKEKIVSVLKK